MVGLGVLLDGRIKSFLLKLISYRLGERPCKIMTKLYPASPDGWIGHEDCGQVSAWLVLGAMGINQVIPGDPRYSHGGPLFPQVGVGLLNGKISLVRMKNDTPTHPYVQRIALNGVPLKTPFVACADSLGGVELMFEMGDRKTMTWK